MGKGQKRSNSPRGVAKEGVLGRQFSKLGGPASLLDAQTSKVFINFDLLGNSIFTFCPLSFRPF